MDMVDVRCFIQCVKMRLYYIAVVYDSIRSGVGQKIVAQLNAMRRNGINATLFYFTATDIGDVDLPGVNIVRLPVDPTVGYLNISKLCVGRFVADYLKDRLLNRMPPGVVYFRYHPPDAYMLRVFHALASRGFKLVTEHQTKEVNEYLLQGSYGKAMLEFMYGRWLGRYLSGMVAVTHEVLSYQMKVRGKLPAIVLGNGIDVERYPVRKILVERYPLRLLFVGSIQRWHGLDRLLKGMAMSDKTGVMLEIVGEGDELPRLKKLTAEFGLEGRVVFHNFLPPGRKLDELFNRAHVGIGALGIHRCGFNETASIKLREYCARGIPFVDASNDVDIGEGFEFRLKIEANESPVDIDRIWEFANRMMSISEHPLMMREYAKRNLDWRVKIPKLMHFLMRL